MNGTHPFNLNISQFSTEQELTLRQLTKNPRISIEDETTSQKCSISTVARSNKITIIANDRAVYQVVLINLATVDVKY